MLAHRVSQGFTLVELVVTLAVAAIIMAAAVPSFRSMIQNNRVATQTNEFVTALNLSRSEAVKRGVPVTICRSSSQTACTAGPNWEVGWIVFTDGGVPGTVDGTDTVLRVHGALSGGTTLASTQVVSSLQYLANGMLSIPPAAVRTFQVQISGCTGTAARAVQISPTGRTNVTQQACP